ncbi:MAG TPA: glutamate--tRNA ligase [Polyangiaceae bacterium]|nr:glutamate--tRNA ligase [Polyangiaceae bacterium]
MGTPRVRFAPSPTGYLHIGGVRTALFNWLWARKTGGAFVLRIEDTDRERSTDASRQVIFDSLRWLGIDWDEGPEVGGPHGPYQQMERLALYKEYAERLIAEGKAFRCYKTRDELDAARAALKEKDPKAEFRYPREWREQAARPGEPHVVRFKVPAEGQVTYVDKVFGEVKTPNAAQQDFVLLRSDGVPLYNFGAVVDDVTMGITLVARGRDHMVNTPPQILLYEALGAPVPEFAHLPMMLNQKGAKLSKRDGAVGVFEYRDKGYTPDAVLNYLARFGWSFGDQEVFSKAELIGAFDWASCGRGDGKFDEKKFLAVQHEHLKSPARVPDDSYVEYMRPFVEARGLAFDPAIVRGSLVMVRERARTLVEAAEAVDYFLRPTPVFDEKAKEKALVPESAPLLLELAERLAATEPFDAVGTEATLHELLAARGLEMKRVAAPVRVALTGRASSPGLYEVMALLGKATTLARLRAAAELCVAGASAAGTAAGT